MFIRSPLALALLPVAASAQLLFGPAASTTLSNETLPFMAAGDVDGDGFADLVIGRAGAPGLRLGDGAGHFGAEVAIDTTATGSSVALADLNGDGLLDLLAGTSVTHHFDVALNLGGGQFGPAATYNTGVTTVGENHLAIKTGNGDVDGDIDVVAVTTGGFGQPSGEVRMFRNLGDGTLGNVGAIAPTPLGFSRVIGGAVLSLNGDNRPDALVVYDVGVQFPLLIAIAAVCNPDGSFTGTQQFQDVDLASTGDVDGDGDVDVLFLEQPGLFEGPPTKLHALLNAGDGTLTEGPIFELSLTNGFRVAGVTDLDGDGVPDLALQESFPPELRLLRGAGDGSFANEGAHVSLSASQGVGQDLLADLDGDDRADVISTLSGGAGSPAILTSMNETYPAGGPLLDLGKQLEGQTWPIQVAAGSFASGTPFAFGLSNAPPAGSAFHVVGLTALNAPFKGGTMVPLPFLITGPWPINAQGQASIAGLWPSGPAGLQILAQFWMADAAGPAGFASSSAVRVVTQ